MKRLILGCLLVCLPLAAQAQVAGEGWNDKTDWTETRVTVFDQVDGDFQPRLTGTVVVYSGGQGLGWFFGEGNTAGLVVAKRVYTLSFSGLDLSAYMLASSNFADGAPEGGSLFNDGTFGFEPRLHWDKLDNLEFAPSIANVAFVDGEAARLTLSFSLVFRL